MAIKIMIDAGHGGFDNGASYNGRTEKNDNLNLALALGDALSELGYDVEFTRTTDVYDSPTRKAQIGNESGADYFISLHRNAAPYPNKYNGVETLVYNTSGIAYEMAENVDAELAMSAAAKILGEDSNDAKNQSLYDEFIEKAGEAHDTESN